LNSAREAIHTG
jgi:hypothetical protein